MSIRDFSRIRPTDKLVFSCGSILSHNNLSPLMKPIRIIIPFLILFVLLLGCDSKREFVKVNEGRLEIAGKQYNFLGTNFWYGMNLGSKGEGGDRERLLRELDALKKMGVTNLRIMAGSEGPDTEPYRMTPSMQQAPGEYNMDVVEGLDFLLYEMDKRDMCAVMCLTNFWNWSGGMGQYIVWSGAADSIPYPPPHPGGKWDGFQEFLAAFYSNDKAMKMLDDHIRFIVTRTNSITGKPYRDDPTIMSWQLANEPRGIDNIDAYRKWINKTAALIKELDSNHLVSTGSEGTTSASQAGTNPELDHADRNIDYITAHIWVQNWGLFDPAKADSTLAPSIDFMKAYLSSHEEIARKLNKPLVLEEFGISRDKNDHDPAAPVTVRDQYYSAVFDAVYNHAAKEDAVVSGVNFWAWGGEGRPETPEGIWTSGHDFIGDPPHEGQGWYSVYDKDKSTIEVISKYATKMKEIAK